MWGFRVAVTACEGLDFLPTAAHRVTQGSETAMCKRCKSRRAESAASSVVKLCGRCAYEVCPGADTDAYRKLLAQYAADRDAGYQGMYGTW
jgi:hypothetical protein